jgi:hypothetical protein
MAVTELADIRKRSTRPHAITITPPVAPRRWLILLHLVLLTAAMLLAASKAIGSPTTASATCPPDAARLAADTPGRSAETESTTKPRSERSPNAGPPPASKRPPARPARKDRVLPNPPEYPPLGRELALR